MSLPNNFQHRSTESIESAYRDAQSVFGQFGVDTEDVLRRLALIPISMHCWQGDDVGGFDCEPDELGDELGGKAVAVINGQLADVQEAVAMCAGHAGSGEVLGASILSNVDSTLRRVLGEGTRFGGCRNWAPPGAEGTETGED